jgi:hypothetical protein
VTTTLFATFGPPFVTTIVYVNKDPVPYGPAAGVFVIDRSATAAVIVVVAVELLLPAFESLAEVTVAVLLLGPAGVVGAICTTMVNVAVVPAVSAAIEQETVPAAPTDGFVQMKAGPVGCDSETKVVFGGKVSDIVTVVASDGPLLVTVMLYVRFVPAVAVAGAVLTTEMSALRVTVVVTVGLFPVAFGSEVAVETRAVLETVPDAFGAMWTVIEKVADPVANEPIVQLMLPVPPTAGLLHENAGPDVCEAETNVVFAGIVSVSETLAAAEGPLFVSVTA